MSERAPGSESRPSSRHRDALERLGVVLGRANLGLAFAFAALLPLHYFVVLGKANINWDEFALFMRGAIALDTNVLQGGGRPGLGTLLTLPFVRACDNAVEAVRDARVLWAVFGLGYLGALVVLLWQVLSRRGDVLARRHALHDALLGAALLSVMPLWLRWSVQVRTDQGALCFGLWAAVLWIASSSRIWLALLAGAALVVAGLFTQKAVYLGALGGCLALGAAWFARDFDRYRELRRAATLGLGALLAWFAWRGFVLGAFDRPPLTTLEGGGKVFDYYRETLGYQLYGHLLEYLWPHGVLCVAGVGCALLARRSRVACRKELLLAACVLALGAAIARFHAAAFAYFWLTIGVFPAVAAALLLGPLRVRLAAWQANGALTLAWLTLLVNAREPATRLYEDTQRHQRETLAFIERNFAPDAVGFHPEGALFCRQQRSAFPTMFSQSIYNRFHTQDQEQRAQAFIQQFRDTQALFIVDSYRLRQFPPAVTRFWQEHYVPASPSLWILGAAIASSSAKHDVEVIVRGRYHWSATKPDTQLLIAGQTLEDGDTLELELGSYPVRVVGPGIGQLHWAVGEPLPRRGQPFFDFVVAAELSGKVY